MGAVPRIFEKVHGRIKGTVAEEGGLKKTIFDWAIGSACRCPGKTRRSEAVGGRDAAIQARRQVGVLHHPSAVRRPAAVLHLRVRGPGPQRRAVVRSRRHRRARGLWPDRDVGRVVAQSPDRVSVRHGGLAVPTTEVKIAEDGEVLIKGPGVMTGYHDLPEATAEALDQDGWFHTGDIGEIDADGFLRITDRKKDMFKTSQGKYVAPSAIAAAFKGICPYASESSSMARQPYCVALVGLDAEAITEWAGQAGHGGQVFAEIARDEKTRELIGGYIDPLNKDLNRWEQVKRFAIIDRELSVEAGDLTPSLKLRRKIVVDNFADDISLRTQQSSAPDGGEDSRVRRASHAAELSHTRQVRPTRDLRPMMWGLTTLAEPRSSFIRLANSRHKSRQQRRGMACDQNASGGW